MATNHTEHYQLNLWEPTDKFVREEFNENNQKIDAAIKAVDAKADTKASTAALNAEANARTAADSALSTALEAKCRVMVGSYTGNDAKSRFISLGCRPKAVLIFCGNGHQYDLYGSTYVYFGGLAVDITPKPTPYLAEFSDTGFYVRKEDRAYTNATNLSYYYIAFC